MATHETDPRYQTPQQLAGPLYDQMMQSKEATLAFLSSPDYRVCIAAVLLCGSTWKCSSESPVIQACRTIAADSTADDSLRICVMNLLGLALMSSESPDASQFPANVVMDPANSIDVRTSAYWALRNVQLGFADSDRDTFLKGTIFTIKSILRENPGQFSEEAVRSNLVPEGRFPKGFWESAEKIDWDFVAQFASQKK